MSIHKIIVAGFLACTGASVALACGPWFPTRLLQHRTAALTAPPRNSFAFEAAHLVVTPAKSATTAETAKRMWMSAGRYRETVEVDGLTADQVNAWHAMRQAETGDKAWALGAILPPAIRLYTAGAVDWRARSGDRGEARFEGVLQLPAAEAQPRATWAAYMLGRISDDPSKFAQVRALVQAGAPDPLDLSVASYGEEARIHLDRASAYLDDKGTLPTKAAAEFLQQVSLAVTLYAEQATRGSDSGVQSLRIIAHHLLVLPSQLAKSGDEQSDNPHGTVDFLTPSLLPVVLADPRIEHLLAAYAASSYRIAVSDDDSNDDDRPFKATPSQPLITLLDAIEARGVSDPSNAERLAAVAYRSGRYETAGKLAAASGGPLSSWIKAKLALQKSDLKAAANFYAEAVKAFPTTDAAMTLDEESKNLLWAESGIVALARNEYVEALDKLYRSGVDHWADTAYVAERVVTVDELKNFVDAKVPNPPPSAKPVSCWSSGPDGCSASLRNLLARRLMRKGRYEEGAAYFHDPEITEKARAYAKALHDGASGTDRISRARAWFTAATLARHSGMELMGYEGDPDYFIYQGDLEEYPNHRIFRYDRYKTYAEESRAEASAAKPDRRYHYRFTAADHISRSADFLPPRSQAFAAVLCYGSAWMIRSHDNLWGLAFYHRYLDEGAVQPWAKTFGQQCPSPDFTAAATFEERQFHRHIWRLLRRFHWLALWGPALILGGGAIGAWGWRMRKRPA